MAVAMSIAVSLSSNVVGGHGFLRLLAYLVQGAECRLEELGELLYPCGLLSPLPRGWFCQLVQFMPAHRGRLRSRTGISSGNPPHVGLARCSDHKCPLE